MAYEVRFDLKQTGAEALASVDAIVQRLSGSTKTVSGDLKVFESVLRASIGAGNSLGESLKTIAATSQGGFEGLSKIAKEAQALGKESKTAADEVQKLGRMMDIAYGENRARDAKALALAQAEVARQARLAAAEQAKAAAIQTAAEVTSNRLGSSLLTLASSSGVVSYQVGSAARVAGVLSGGLGQLIGPATIAGAVILGAGVAALSLVKAYAEASRETVNFADRIGVSVGQARQLQQVGQLAGVSVETLAGSSRYLANALEDSEGAGKKTTAALERLGVSTTSLNGGAREEGQVLLDVIQALSQIPDQAERVREGNAALGRGAKDILPLVEQYRDLRDILTSYGISVDANAIQKGAEAERQFQALSLALQQFRDQAGVAIAPIIIPFVRTLITAGELAAAASVTPYRADETLVREGLEGFKAALGISYASLAAADLSGAKGGLNALLPTPDVSGMLGQAKKQQAARFQASLGDSDDKYGLTRANKQLEAAQKNLVDVTGDSARGLADQTSAERAVQASLAKVRGIQEQIKSTQQLNEETKRLNGLQARDAEKAIKDPIARAIYTANAQAATFTSPANRAAAGLSGAADVQAAAGAELRKNSDSVIKGIEQQDSGGQKLFGEQLRLSIKQLTEQVEAYKKTQSTQNQLTTESTAESVRSNASGGTFADRLTSLNPRLTDAQKIAVLNQQDLATAREKYRIELEGASELMGEKEQKNAAHKAELDNELELQKIKEQNVERLAELENKHIEEFRGLIGGLFDAATSRQPNAIPNFVKSQVLNVGKTITENAAQQYLLKPLQQLRPTSPGGPIGAILKGTGLVKDAASDPIKLSNDLNTAATDKNTAQLAQMRAQAMSRSGGGGGTGASAGGTGPLGSFGSYDPSSGTYSGIGSPSGDIGDGLPMSSGAYGASAAAKDLSAGGGSGFGFNGKTLAAGAAAVGAGFVAAGDFSRGGAKSDIAGVGAVLGGAAGIAALIPGGQVVALGLGIAAAATSLISAVMPDPRVVRENAINKELALNQYIAPQALNVTQDSSGNFADFDARGNIRTSTFSAIPTVRQGSTWEQTHGLFGGPPTFYSVPGGQTSQFGAPTAPPAPAQPIIIQAMDAQSFNDYAQRNHAAIGNAAAKALQNAHGALSSEVHRTANG